MRQPGRWVLGIAAVLSAGLVACGSDSGGEGSGGASGSSNGGSGDGGASAAGGDGGSAAGGSGNASSGGTGTSGGSAGQGSGSDGCGKQSPTGVDEEATIEVGGETRHFVLSVPDGYDPTSPLPLIFGFHGLNADGKAAHNYLRLEQATGKPAIFVYPSSRSSSAGWQMKEGEGDIEFFDALVEQLTADYCIDSSRIFSTGFSHGAMFTNNLTCARIDTLRAIAPIGGSGPWFGAACSGAVPALLVHGMKDGTVLISDGEKSRDHWLGENGCGTETKAYDPDPCVAYEGCTDPVVFCAFDGGHTVPDFAGQAVRNFFDSM